MKPYVIVTAFTCIWSASVAASGYRSDYQGQQGREIKSLSSDDILQLKQGKGWGMAKPAELNGYPGPRHVLDMASEMALSADQRIAIEALYQTMKEQAVIAGQRLLKNEQALEQAFRQRQIDQDTLVTLVKAAESARSDLRYIHLNTHLQTITLLSRHQTTTYNRLRGYGATEDNHNH